MATADRVVERSSELLTEHQGEWGSLWRSYALDVQHHGEAWREARKRFRTPPELRAYSNVTKLKKGSTTFDLRYRGQLVGFLEVKQREPVKLVVKKDQAASNARYFPGLAEEAIKVDWRRDPRAREFRQHFARLNAAAGRVPEHAWESLIIDELEKSAGDDKALRHVRPVRLGRLEQRARGKKKEGKIRFQMPLPLSGSDKTGLPTYSAGSSGSVDILARIGRGGTGLGVLELKKPKPGKAKPLSQALIYGTALAHVLRNDEGDRGWWWLFGFDRAVPDALTIRVASVCHEGDLAMVEKDREELGLGFGDWIRIPGLPGENRLVLGMIQYSGNTSEGQVHVTQLEGFGPSVTLGS